MPKKLTCAPGKWIPCALEHHKPGSLHRMLHISKKEKIPDKLLERVMAMEIGSALMIKGNIIPITRLLKQRANLALTLRRF
jgi:hypothetical protein